MKKDLFQRIFERKISSSRPSARRLSLEALENRELLNADWGGFAPEKTTEFEATASEYSIDLSERAPNFCELSDLNADGVDELLTINYSEKTLDVYANDKTGAYVLKKSIAIAELIDANDSPVVFGDVVGSDGINDLVVVSQTTTGAKLALTATVYQGSADYTFTKKSTTALDVSAFPSSGLAFLSLDVALRETASGADLLVQGATLSMGSGGASPRQTLIYSGVGENNFGKSATSLNLSGSSTTDDPILTGVATIGGKECVVSIDRGSSQSNALVLTDLSATTPKKYVADLSSLGSVVVEWVVEKDGVLIVGGTIGKNSSVITLNDFAFADGSVKFTSNVVACDGLTLNASSVAAIGNMGGMVATPELLVANGSSYVVFQGETSRTYGLEFKQTAVVSTTPSYHSVYVGDVDGDGKTETLLVGATQITVADAEEDGSVTNAKTVATFGQTAKKAVFGDFNGDGLIDVAAYYQAEGSDFTVGTNLQIFQQISDGTFAPVASRAVSAFVDFTVGSFSQAGVDEIAVLSQTTSGAQYVEMLRLTVSAGATTLNSSRSYRLGSLGATSLTVGSIYGGELDDIVAVNSAKNSISVLKNTGSTFNATTLSSGTGLVASGDYKPTAAAIGDINGDGLNDVVVLNSASGSNRAHIAYYLQTAAGLSAVETISSPYISGVAPTGLALADLNGDGKLDVATVQNTTAGKSNVFGFLNNGTASIFDAGKSLGATATGGALTVGRFNNDASLDLILAQGKKVGVFLNTEGGETSGGSVKFVCQSASAAPGANLAAALATERTWLDEWSNFYIDVWATTDGAGVVTTASAALKFNPEYFTLVGVENATGFNASISVANGVATVSATGKAASDGWALVARVRFSPKVNAVGVYEGGIAIPQDGVIKSVSADFSAVAASQSVNGSAVATVAAPTDLVVYPVAADANDDGSVGANDLTNFVLSYGAEVAYLPNNLTFCGVFDFNADGKIVGSDLTEFVLAYGSKANGVSDSFYSAEPSLAASSAVLESDVETAEGVYTLANPTEVVAVPKAARTAVDAALVAEALAAEFDDEEEIAARRIYI
ncbi:MAG: VCBS repeat-containing protein [Thermoguttaceae bacterium]|nr:VCBS repeat-containing protein [Thermoguttaceae bacterium]